MGVRGRVVFRSRVVRMVTGSVSEELTVHDLFGAAVLAPGRLSKPIARIARAGTGKGYSLCGQLQVVR